MLSPKPALILTVMYWTICWRLSHSAPCNSQVLKSKYKLCLHAMLERKQVTEPVRSFAYLLVGCVLLVCFLIIKCDWIFFRISLGLYTLLLLLLLLQMMTTMMTMLTAATAGRNAVIFKSIFFSLKANWLCMRRKHTKCQQTCFFHLSLMTF